MKCSSLIFILLSFLSLFSFFPLEALAHMGTGSGGFMAGISHPVLGADHLLAMLSVGMISAQMGGTAIWKVPTTFVCVMLLGGILGMFKIQVPLVEFGIALSVLFLGVSIALEKKLKEFWIIIVVAFFATFHGHAHGSEMPSVASPIFYALGFVTGTALIHIAGVFLAYFLIKTTKGAHFLEHLGSAFAGIGFYILLGAIL